MKRIGTEIKRAKTLKFPSFIISGMLILILFVAATGSKAVNSIQNITQDPVFEKVAVMPLFKEGDVNTFRNWVQTNVKYPEEAKKAGISGKVFVEFIIEKDGTVKEVKIKKGVNELNDEVLRVIKSSPKWAPGKNEDGKTVRVQFMITINFALK